MVDLENQNQLIDDQNDTRQSNLFAENEESKQLIGDDEEVDESLFQGLDKNHSLVVSRREYDKIKIELAKALAKRADKSKKTTPEDEKLKAKLQRSLLKQQSVFKEE